MKAGKSPAVGPLPPGLPAGRHRIRDRDRLREVIERLAGLPERNLEVLFPTLDPDLFDRPRLQQVLRLRIARRRRLQVRILVRDLDESLRRGHRLVALAREFPSHAAIRRLEASTRERLDECFLIVDERCCLHRRPLNDPDTLLCCDGTPLPRSLRHRFDALWEPAETPTELRRLYL
ncbi:MAG: hypothetical protein D6721_04610 [Gammaproteobacteria bacterium]|nr:MAG: hypothetical protein D6721_04610 [Gammaproteobacteria bacterium]